MFKLYTFSLLLFLLFSGCSDEISLSTPSKTIDTPLDDDTTLVTAPNTPDYIPLLLVRLEYQNAQFTQNALTWSNKIFGNSNHQLNHYYGEVSAGKFSFQRAHENEDIEEDGVITILLDKNHPDSGSDYSIHSDLKEALERSDQYINYAIYDTDSNGHISFQELQIVFIVAGNEDAYSGDTSEPGVWGHQDCTLNSNTPTLDGVSLMSCNNNGTYALFGERHSDYDQNSRYIGSHDASIGIIAHELGHSAFDLPDLYDVDDSSAGIGYFGLMSGGTWGYAEESEVSGYTPTHMCAWSKVKNGWVTPIVVTQVNDKAYTLSASALSNMDILKIPTQVANEYFLVENRANLGYDKGLNSLDGSFIGGMAIWHIDETTIYANYASNRIQTNESHKGIDLEEALNARLDSSPYEHGDAKNLFYRRSATRFTPSTSPNSRLYNSNDTAIEVENISSVSSTMTLTITNPN